MSGGFVICEYDKVKQEFPEYLSVMNETRNKLIAKAEKDWDMTFSGRRKIVEAAKFGVNLMPPGPGLDVDAGAGEFGESTVIPAAFRNISNTTLTSWHQWFTATGAQIIMSGANGGNIYKDYKIGLVGLAFLDKAIRISEFKMQISDKKIGRVNVEEAMVYNKPAFVLEEGYILDEETGFDLTALVLSQGPQTIKLLGQMVYRVKDKMLTNTGAALL